MIPKHAFEPGIRGGISSQNKNVTEKSKTSFTQHTSTSVYSVSAMYSFYSVFPYKLESMDHIEQTASIHSYLGIQAIKKKLSSAGVFLIPFGIDKLCINPKQRFLILC